MKIGSVIKEYRHSHDLSMQEFADKCGLSKGYISMLERGTHPQNNREIIPSIGTVQKIASVMGITVDTLLASVDGDQRIDITKSAPLYETAAGRGRLNDGYPTDEYNVRLEADEIAARVVGRSMEPTLLDGDVVIIAAQNVPDYDGQICLVKINGDESTVKRVERKSNGIMLVGDNTNVYAPKFYTAEEVEQLPVKIEGVVRRLIRDIK